MKGGLDPGLIQLAKTFIVCQTICKGCCKPTRSWWEDSGPPSVRILRPAGVVLPRVVAVSSKRRKVGRVTGIGGVFLRARKPEALAAWYRDHLGMEIKDQMAIYDWISPKRGKRGGTTLWAALATGDRDWGRGRPSALVNYRVANLDQLLVRLRAKGVRVSPDAEASPYGKFGWAEDPEGNRLELWELPRRSQASDRHVPME